MAEEYVIRIVADQSAKDEKKIPVAMPGDGGVSNPTSKSPVSDQGAVSVNMAKMVAAGVLMPAVTTMASTAVGVIGLQTGNNKLQQKINTVTSLASKVSGLSSTVVTYAAIGGPVGAAVGAMAWGIGEAAQISATVMRHNIEYNNECQKLGVLRDRAGIATNRRR